MRLSSGRGRAIATSLMLFLASCASLPSIKLAPNERTAAGARSIEGRISVRYKDLSRDKEDALSGRFEWTQSGNDIELSLLDPLGQTVALIRSNPNHSSITFRDGRKVEGATPEALTQDTLGWTIPLGGLTSWLDGRPAAGSTAVTLGDGRLRQDHWTIRFVRENDKVNVTGTSATISEDVPADVPADLSAGLLLPKRIDLFYPGPPAEIEMRLVIDSRSGA